MSGTTVGVSEEGAAGVDLELSTMTEVIRALSRLDPTAQRRVLSWVSSRLTAQTGVSGEDAPVHRERGDVPAEREVSVPKSSSSDFQFPAELFDAARPRTDTEKALVLAYWFQVCQSQPSFSSRQVNDELKHIGYGVSNITRALDTLSAVKPALVIQLEKAGKTQQAQKKFKVTHEGLKRVQQLLASTVEDK
jgi:hypothetical protein